MKYTIHQICIFFTFVLLVIPTSYSQDFKNSLQCFLSANDATSFQLTDCNVTTLKNINGLTSDKSVNYATYTLYSDCIRAKLIFQEFIVDSATLPPAAIQYLTQQHILPFFKSSPKGLAASANLPPHWEIRVDSVFSSKSLLFFSLESLEKDSASAKKFMKGLPELLRQQSCKAIRERIVSFACFPVMVK